MSNNATYTRIYELKAAGVPAVLNDINAVIKRLEVLGQVKDRVSAGSITDPSGIADFNKQIDSLVSSVDKMAATAEKSAESQIKLSEALTEVLNIQKEVTVSMKDSMAAMQSNIGTNAMIVTKMQGSFSTMRKESINYQESIAALSDKLLTLKGNLAEVNEAMATNQKLVEAGKIDQGEYEEAQRKLIGTQMALKTQITEVTGAMTAMNKTFNPALTEEENAALAANRVELQQRNQLLKLNAVAEAAAEGSIKEARAVRAQLALELQQLNVVQDENIAKVLGSTMATEANIERQKELIATIDMLDGFIKANSDAYTQQKINIGNYPDLIKQSEELKVRIEQETAAYGAESEMVKKLNADLAELEAKKAQAANGLLGLGTPSGATSFTTVSQQLGQVKTQMQTMIVAGQQGSEEFKQLEARAIELAAAMREVSASTGRATFSLENLGKRLETMGFRMLIHMAIFQVAMELISALGDAMTKTARETKEYEDKLTELDHTAQANAEKEKATAAVLLSIAQDYNQKMDIRTRAVKDLQDKYPDYLGNLSQEAILTGKTADAMERLNEAFLNKALMEASESKIELAAKKYIEIADKIAELKNKLEALQTQKLTGQPMSGTEEVVNEGGTPQEAYDRQIKAVNDDLNEQLELQKEAQEEMQKYQNYAKAFAAKAVGLIVPSDTKKKALSTYKEDFAADKDLADAQAKLQLERIKRDQESDRVIYENMQKSLAERIEAYAGYYYRVQAIAQTEADREIEIEAAKRRELKAKLADEIKKDPHHSSKYQDDYNKEIEASELRLAAARIKLDVTVAKAKEDNAKAITATTKAQYDQELKDLQDYLIQRKTYNEQDAIEAKELIYSKHYGSEKEQRELQKVDQAKTIADDLAQIGQDEINMAKLQNDLELEQKKEQNDLVIALEKNLNDQLLKLRERYIQDKGKLQTDSHKKEEENLHLDQLSAEGMVQIATEFGNQYISLLQKQEDQKLTIQQRQMDYNMKLLNSENQSKQEQLKNEKAYMVQQRAMQKEKMEQDKRHAEAQALLDYASAAISILTKTIGTYPTPAGWAQVAINEGVLSALFAVKEGFLASAPTYAEGTDSHPGGWAWVGDGNEHELIKIGNNYSVSPAKATPVNLPAGAQVIPFSHISNVPGNLGTNLKAPSFNTSSRSSSSGPDNYHASFSELHGMMTTIMGGLANMTVHLDTTKAGRAINNTYYKQVKL